MVISMLGEDVECSHVIRMDTSILYTFKNKKSLLRVSVENESYIDNMNYFYTKHAAIVVLHSKFGNNKILYTITNTELLKSLYQ